MIDRRILICAAVSIIGHVAIARGLDELPPRDRSAPPDRVTVRVVEPPPPKLEPPPPEPPKPPEPKVIPEHLQPRPAVTRPAAEPQPAIEPALSSNSTTGDPNAKPRFGVSMESTSQAGTTRVPVGNTTTPTGPTDPGPARPVPPAPAHEVTKMPLPHGRCAGKYTDAARTAAIEGVVILDVIVDETGRTREIQVVEGLSHGLTEAAIAALRACRFTPGEKGGAPVPVRVRGFKIRFLLQGGS